MKEIFSNGLLGSLYVIVIVVFIINLGVLLFREYLKRAFHISKISFDDNLIREVMKPIYFLAIFLTFYFLIIQTGWFEEYDFYLDRGIFTIAVGFLAVFFAKVVSAFTNYWLRVKKRTKHTPRLVMGTVSALIYLSAGIIILSHWGVQITPLVAALGVGGLAIGLGLQETLSNLFAGLHIVSDEPVRVGDYIEIGTDIAGEVEDIGWRSTRLKTIQNNVIIVPNAELAKSTIVNIAAESPEISVVIPCGVAYGSDLEKTESVILDEIEKYRKTNTYISKKSVPMVLFNQFGESNINFNVIVRAHKYTDRFVIKHELIKAIKKRLDSEGIEISWPIRKIVK